MNGSLYSNSVMKIIAVNVAIFAVQSLFFAGETLSQFIRYFGLTPALVTGEGYVWQFFSYMFLHGSFWHIFFNMYALLIFGIQIEQAWGTKRFLKYYLFTGIGAGLTIFIVNGFIDSSLSMVPTIGASGAVFGVLLAFGVLFPNAELLLFFVLPIKAKYLVIMYGVFTLSALLSTGTGGNISHAGHLGGLIFGILYFLYQSKFGKPLRTKAFKAKTSFETKKSNAIKRTETEQRTEDLMNILRKLKEKGIDSLTDDDFQKYKYAEIMFADSDKDHLCSEKDFDLNEEYCKECEFIESCIIREMEKYIK